MRISKIAARSLRIDVGGFKSAIVIILITFFVTSCNFRELPVIKSIIRNNEEAMTRQTDEAIRNSTELKELNSVCLSVPLPADAQFIWKGGFSDKKLSLSYYYYSDTPYEEAKHVFKSHFANAKWDLITEKDSYPKSMEFNNDKYRIWIFFGGMGERTNYSISCEKL